MPHGEPFGSRVCLKASQKTQHQDSYIRRIKCCPFFLFCTLSALHNDVLQSSRRREPLLCTHLSLCLWWLDIYLSMDYLYPIAVLTAWQFGSLAQARTFGSLKGFSFSLHSIINTRTKAQSVGAKKQSMYSLSLVLFLPKGKSQVAGTPNCHDADKRICSLRSS